MWFRLLEFCLICCLGIDNLFNIKIILYNRCTFTDIFPNFQFNYKLTIIPVQMQILK